MSLRHCLQVSEKFLLWELSALISARNSNRYKEFHCPSTISTHMAVNVSLPLDHSIKHLDLSHCFCLNQDEHLITQFLSEGQNEEVCFQSFCTFSLSANNPLHELDHYLPISTLCRSQCDSLAFLEPRCQVTLVIKRLGRP